ncbi:M12 family metallopeptidase [Roseobacter sp. EG26]|uniref:M12 family metallopeptidase n=1 Tax=Roseobacter sp. EG26 TaxID=3412477 RepID=UPI003CE4640B
MSDYDPDTAPDGLLLSNTVKTGYVRGVYGSDKFSVREIEYSVVDGLAVFEGCIVLGTTDEMAALSEQVTRDGGVDLVNATEGFGLTVLSRYLWPEGIVPYQIDENLPDANRVIDAIAHWETKTKIRFVPYVDQADFVTFRPGSGCSANVGCVGGEQFVNLGPGCTLGNTIHEIGHALGLWHEQSRSDRDQHVEVRYDNIHNSALHNFNRHIYDGVDRGPYDYGSIMHYPPNAFAKDPLKPTLVAPDGVEIGQRLSLSSGDVAAIEQAYAEEFEKRDNV